MFLLSKYDNLLFSTWDKISEISFLILHLNHPFFIGTFSHSPPHKSKCTYIRKTWLIFTFLQLMIWVQGPGPLSRTAHVSTFSSCILLVLVFSSDYRPVIEYVLVFHIFYTLQSKTSMQIFFNFDLIKKFKKTEGYGMDFS